METIFDVLTVAIFAGLIVLFLQRSTSEEEPTDSLWQYLVASVGCALANYLGNEGVKSGTVEYTVAAVLVLAGTLAFIHYVLKPFSSLRF